MLAFARQQTITPKILDLNGAVDNTLKMLQRLIGEGIDLTWEPSSNVWKVKVEPSQIDQILANLCVNARDAIGGAGRADVAVDCIRNTDGAQRDPAKPFALFLAHNSPHTPFQQVPEDYVSRYGDAAAETLLNRPNVRFEGNVPRPNSTRSQFRLYSDALGISFQRNVMSPLSIWKAA